MVDDLPPAGLGASESFERRGRLQTSSNSTAGALRIAGMLACGIASAASLTEAASARNLSSWRRAPRRLPAYSGTTMIFGHQRQVKSRPNESSWARGSAAIAWRTPQYDQRRHAPGRRAEQFPAGDADECSREFRAEPRVRHCAAVEQNRFEEVGMSFRSGKVKPRAAKHAA